MFCAKCGKELPEGAAFCSECGAPCGKSAPGEEPEEAGRTTVRDVHRARRGDQAAFEDLYRASHDRAFFVARRLMGSDEAAADVLQDSYVKAYASIGDLKDPQSFQTWLDRIVSNTACDLLRKHDPLAFSTSVGEGDGEVDLVDDDPSVQPEQVSDKRAVTEAVRGLVDALPPDQRACVMAYYFSEAPVKDIASDLGIPENTVKSRLNRARAAIEAEVARREERTGTKLFGAVPFAILIHTLREDGRAYAAPYTAASVITAAGGSAAAGVIAAGSGASAATVATGSLVAWASSHTVALIVATLLAAAVVVGGVLGYGYYKDAAAVVPESQVVSDMTTADVASVAGATLSYVQNDAYATSSVDDVSASRGGDTCTGTCTVTLDNTPSEVVAQVSFTYQHNGGDWVLADWQVTGEQVTPRTGVDSDLVTAALSTLMATADASAGSTITLQSIYGVSGAALNSNTTTTEGGTVTFALGLDNTEKSASGTLTVTFAFQDGDWQVVSSMADAGAYAVTAKTKMVWVLTKSVLASQPYDYDTYQYDSDGQLVSRTWYGDDGGNSTYECSDGMMTSETFTDYTGVITSLSYSYDTEGRCVQRTSLVLNVGDAKDGVVGQTTTCTYSYDSSNRLVTASRDSSSTTYSYSGGKLIGSIFTSLSGSSIQSSDTYSYDSNGNVATMNYGSSTSWIYTWEQIEVPATAKVFDGINIVCEVLWWK